MGITKKPSSDCVNDNTFRTDIEDVLDYHPIFHISDENLSSQSEDIDDDNDNDIDIDIDIDTSFEDFINQNGSSQEFTTYVENLTARRERGVVNEINELFGFGQSKTNEPVIKKNAVSEMGRRKMNRAQNEKFLLSLGDTEQYDPKDEIFFNENKYGFTKVMNILCTNPEVKESFIEGNEDILLKEKKKNLATQSNHKKLKRNISPELAFENLTPSQKSLFKQKTLPLSIIDHLESEVVQYFSSTPDGIYSSMPLINYHRILLHGIVRYYSLAAKSLNTQGHRSQKIIQVRNKFYEDFKPPRMSLLKYISRLNKKHV